MAGEVEVEAQEPTASAQEQGLPPHRDSLYDLMQRQRRRPRRNVQPRSDPYQSSIRRLIVRHDYARRQAQRWNGRDLWRRELDAWMALTRALS